jgi:hypothetical protein
MTSSEGARKLASLMRTEDDENNEETQKQKDEQNQAEEVGKVEKKEGQVEVSTVIGCSRRK